ncbi:MAG: hypothetical protein IKR81_14320 [Victivallales bacterium]|jgi:chromosome segregation ATPase|nr:hypothetical protein [Victivallales bacterium]
MAFFSHSPTPEERAQKLEGEAQSAIQRIGGLRAQLSQLQNEEKQVISEYEAAKERVEALQHRREEVEAMKHQAESLEADIKARQEKQSALEESLTKVKEEKRVLIAKIAELRAQVSNEEKQVEAEKVELARLEGVIAENAERKQKILQDLEFFKNSESELAALEEQYKQIAESIPLLRKQYEQTQKLVEGMRNNTDPVAQGIQEIWGRLPADVLDKRLIIPPRNPR